MSQFRTVVFLKLKRFLSRISKTNPHSSCHPRAGTLRRDAACGAVQNSPTFLFLCQTERATRNMSFSCSGHPLEGGWPLTRESSALAVGFMNTKMPLHNADQTLFLYPILNYESLLLVCWIPASGGDAACAGMTIFAWSFSIMPPTETCSEYLEISLRGYDDLLFDPAAISLIYSGLSFLDTPCGAFPKLGI